MMRKAKQILLAAVAIGVLLTGCAGRSSSFSPEANCVYVSQDGSAASALVKKYEGEAVDENDLKQYLEAAVIRYNKENGGQETAVNQQGSAGKQPAALQSVQVKDGVMKAIFEYSTVENLVKFRQTNDNADESNTITAIEVKSAADADSAGWLAEGNFVKADGSAVTAEEIKKNANNFVAAIDGGGTVMFAGKVQFMNEGTEKKDEYTVTIQDGEKAYVVFK